MSYIFKNTYLTGLDYYLFSSVKIVKIHIFSNISRMFFKAVFKKEG